MSSRLLLGVLLGGCLWLGTSSVQAQKPKVVVMDFAGSGGSTARSQVLRGLDDEVTFEMRSDAKRVLAEEGEELSSVAGRAAVAEELGLDYLIWGRVRGRGSAARAEIRIAGPQGKQITELEAGPPGQSKGNAKIRKAARAALAKAMQVAPPNRQTKKVEPITVDEIEITVGEIEITLGEDAKPAKQAETPKAEKAQPSGAATAKRKPVQRRPRRRRRPRSAPAKNDTGRSSTYSGVRADVSGISRSTSTTARAGRRREPTSQVCISISCFDSSCGPWPATARRGCAA